MRFCEINGFHCKITIYLLNSYFQKRKPENNIFQYAKKTLPYVGGVIYL